MTKKELEEIVVMADTLSAAAFNLIEVFINTSVIYVM